ncbi:disintegrin and metalloproteinase domain-containing protein 11-like isoform X1 [Lampetra fluviatilis]
MTPLLLLAAWSCGALPGLGGSHPRDGGVHRHQSLVSKEIVTPFRLVTRMEDGNETAVAALSTKIRQRTARAQQQIFHIAQASFLINVFGLAFILDVHLNHDLLSSNYMEKHFNGEGRSLLSKGGEHCYYQGKIRGVVFSVVAISTCQGLHGMFGDGNFTYLILPLRKSSKQDKEHPHAVYRNTGLGPAVRPFAYERTSLKQDPDVKSDVLRTISIKRIKRMIDTKSAYDETKYVELAIVNDYFMFKKHHLSLTHTNSFAKSVVNLVDAIYKEQLNTRIVLVSMETWTDRNRLVESDDPLHMLHLFMQYRQQNMSGRSDTVHLFTGRTFLNSRSGAAFVGSICSTAKGGGINEYSNPEGMAVTLSQNIAQNLGMMWEPRHSADDSVSCKCLDKWNGCIMMEDSGFHLPRTFSQCSLVEYQELLQQGGGACLFNKPTQLLQPPECGNGFVEHGEECDCGSSAECEKMGGNCCKKCTLTHEALCGNGLCCDSECQLLSRGEVCREAVNDCDVNETCTGDSSQCPENVHKQDGYWCNDQQGRCYQGECKSRDGHCKYIWGSRVVSADKHCYEKLNVEANEKGNCGKRDSSWIRCQKDDILCGYLHCSSIAWPPRVGEMDGDITKVEMYKEGRYIDCSGGHVILADGMDLGYVPDGAPCGHNMICLRQKCNAIRSLNLTACPSNTEDSCSGRGICSNMAKCVCDHEWAGSDCSVYDPLIMAPLPTEKPIPGPSAANIIIGSIAGAILVASIVIGGTGWGFKPAPRRRDAAQGPI